MRCYPKLVDVDEDVMVVVEGISNNMVLMIVIIQIHIKGKPHGPPKNGIISR